jgi:hypothetical protein
LIEICGCKRNELASYLWNTDDRDEAWSMSQRQVRRFYGCELSTGRSGIFAALIGVTRWKTFSFRAAISRLRGHHASEAVERSDQQEDRQQREANVNRSTHL